MIGLNPAAARAAGMPLSRITLLVIGLSGGLAGLAGICEVAGVLNLGVEGMMLVGALTGFVVTQAGGQPWAGVLAAAAAGMALSLVHAFLTMTLRANQVISGLALTIFGTGVSGLWGKAFIGSPTAVPGIPRGRLWGPTCSAACRPYNSASRRSDGNSPPIC